MTELSHSTFRYDESFAEVDEEGDVLVPSGVEDYNSGIEDTSDELSDEEVIANDKRILLDTLLEHVAERKAELEIQGYGKSRIKSILTREFTPIAARLKLGSAGLDEFFLAIGHDPLKVSDEDEESVEEKVLDHRERQYKT